MREEAALSWNVRAATAAFGFSLAIALAPRLQFAARPSDPLSALKLAGYRPSGLILQFALAVLLTALFAILGERIARLLVAHRWAAISYSTALLLAPIALMHFGNVRHVLLLGIAAAAIVFLRRVEPHFTRGDLILILTTLSCHIAFLDLDFGGTPIATFLRAAIAVFFARLIVRDSEAWTLTPLALAAQIVRIATPIGVMLSAAIALAILFGTPFLRLRVSRRIIYPIAVVLYPLAVLQIPPAANSANFFEDSHNIVVAGEMMRGEKPYADIIPTHGLISDGVVDYVAMQLGADSLRSLLDIRLVTGTLSSLAVFCLVLAATGSADIALLGTLLAFCLFPGSVIWLRPSAAMFALAAMAAGTRLRARRYFVMAGALVVVAYLLSVDFGIYSAITGVFAAFRARALRAFAIGLAAALVPALLIFAVFGFAADFITVNLFEILGSHGVYFVRPLEIPECLRSPALVNTLERCVEAMTWVIALIASSIAFARSPLRAKRSDAPWLIGVWIVVAGASFVERGNYHFFVAVTPFIVSALFVMQRPPRRTLPAELPGVGPAFQPALGGAGWKAYPTPRPWPRTVAIVLGVIVVLRAEPFRHVITVVPQLRAAKQSRLFDARTEASIAAAKKFAMTLKADETFVDFSNSALLYWLLKRDCPLRQVEVANYQSIAAQRDVIQRIEHNPRVRAVLVAFPGSEQNVDGIPNSARAPLVWSYLRQHFTPSFDEAGVVFWKRR